MARTVVVVVARAAPHELLLLVSSIVLGAFYTVGLPPPESVGATQPTWVIHVWAAAMLASGLAGVVGCFWRWDRERGLRVEGGAMDLGAAAMLLYAGSLFAYAGERATASGVTFGLWTAANIWRSLQIRAQLRELHQ